MLQISNAIQIVFAILLYLILAIAQPVFSQSANEKTWLDKTAEPIISETGSKDLSTLEITALKNLHTSRTSDSCINREVPTGSTQKMSGCWYPTKIGMLEEGGRYLLKHGDSIAYRISGTSSDSPKLYPTKNPNTFLEARLDAGTGYGFYMTLRNLDTAQTSLTNSANSYVHSFIKNGRQYSSNGRLAHVEASHVRQSDNGKWMTITGESGAITRINLDTFKSTSVKLRDKPSNKWIPGSSSITNDGHYIATAIHGSQFSELFITDLSGSCTENETNMVVEYKNCPNRSLKSHMSNQMISYSSVILPNFVGQHTLSIYHSPNGNIFKEYEIQAPNTTKNSTSYMAFGDSFTSGEGAYSYTPGTDLENENMCHLSSKSYPFLLQKQFNIQQFSSVACSGAKIHNILHSSQARQPNPPTPTTPGYQAQIKYLQHATEKPSNITVSIGGNDIQFANKLKHCITRPTDCYNTYEDRTEIINEINSQQSRLQEMIKKLKSSAPATTKIHIIGYPSIVNEGTGTCGINMPLSKKERELANIITDHLNHVINQSAKAESVNYIDIKGALIGHRLCEAQDEILSMHGITYGDDAGIERLKFLAKETLHPNEIGQQLIKNSILGSYPDIFNTSSHAPSSTSSQNEAITKDAPKTNRTTYANVSTKLAEAQTLLPGQKISINLEPFENNTKPNHKYEIYIDDELQLSKTSNNLGNISAELEIPIPISEGVVQLSIKGLDSSNIPTKFYQYISTPITPPTPPQANMSSSDTDDIPHRPSHKDTLASSLATLPPPIQFRALPTTTSTPKILQNVSLAAHLGEQPLRGEPANTSKVLEMSTINNSMPSNNRLSNKQTTQLAIGYAVATSLFLLYIFRRMHKKLRKN